MQAAALARISLALSGVPVMRRGPVTPRLLELLRDSPVKACEDGGAAAAGAMQLLPLELVGGEAEPTRASPHERAAAELSDEAADRLEARAYVETVDLIERLGARGGAPGVVRALERRRLAAVTRIIAGAARGRRLAAPRGTRTRPTSDKVRGAVFNVLGQFFDGGDVLDLYAGTGALALEALSRGCARAVCVEADREAAEVIAANAEACGVADRVEVRRGRVLDVVPRLPPGRFALAFIDPPYEEGPEAALALLEGALAPGGAPWRSTTPGSRRRTGTARSSSPIAGNGAARECRSTSAS